ncbi:MAG: hypothetical protein ACTSSG_14215, partial [Candidatus Heimdallarchaeaceae archaeon]
MLISYFFPPNKSVGGLRSSSLCKYFPKEGLEIVLLTAEEKLLEREDLQKEYNLKEIFIARKARLREIGYKTKILAMLELLNIDKLLFFPDIYFPWIKRAVKEGNLAIEKTKPDKILVTGPPFTSFVVAYKLAIKHNLPLILDYRDPWSGNPFVNYPLKMIKKKVVKFEKKIVSKAELLVTVGQRYAEVIGSTINTNPADFNIVYNGYFAEKGENKKFGKNRVRFTFSFFGNFYLLQKKVFSEVIEGLGE